MRSDPPAVGALCHRHDPGGHGRRRTTRRTPRTASKVPRRARRRLPLGLGVAGQAELGHGRLAGHHRSGSGQEGDRAVVEGHRGIVQRGRAGSTRESGDQGEVLDRAGHAAQGLTRGRSRVRVEDGRRGERPLVGQQDEGPDVVVEPLGPFEAGDGDLECAELASPDRRRRLQGS